MGGEILSKIFTLTKKNPQSGGLYSVTRFSVWQVNFISLSFSSSKINEFD